MIDHRIRRLSDSKFGFKNDKEILQTSAVQRRMYWVLNLVPKLEKSSHQMWDCGKTPPGCDR